MTTCSNCRKGTLNHQVATVRVEIGRHVVENGSAFVDVCPECQHQDLTSGELAAFELRAASFIMRGDLGQVAGAEIKDVRKVLGLRQTELARLIDRDSSTISRYETDKEEIPPSIKLALAGLVERVMHDGREALDLSKKPADSGEFRLTTAA